MQSGRAHELASEYSRKQGLSNSARPWIRSGVVCCKEWKGHVREKLLRMRQQFTPTAALVLITYALYRSVAYSSYVTNFGWYSDALGYVSTIPFMAGASVGNLASGAAVLALYLKGMLKPYALKANVPLATLALTYCIVALFPQAMGNFYMLVALGLVWGVATTVATIALIELLAYGASPTVLIVQLAASSLLSAMVSLAVDGLPSMVGNALCVLIAVAVIPLLRACRRRVEPYCMAERKASFREAFKSSSTPILACAFFELITGLVNMYAYNSASSFVIVAEAPTQGMAICAVLVALFVFATNRAPNQRVVYLAVFPGVITVFLILPFFSDMLSRPISTVIYSAYVFTSMLSAYCYIVACRNAHSGVYGMAALSAIIVRVCLIVGLLLGWHFGSLSEGETFMHLSIVCVVCVYVLGMVVLLWSYRSAREKRVEVVLLPETFEESVAARADELTEEFGLTSRERDVLVGLAHGNTAASIARDLFLSTSTVQGYIKALYVKLGVNRKQQVIDLFSPKPPES